MLASRDMEHIVYLLQYVGTDYPIAVADGRVIHEAEYQELLRFSLEARERYLELRGRAAVPEIAEGLAELHETIVDRAPWDAVLARSGTLVAKLIDEEALSASPRTPPDIERGRRLYVTDCAPCHGDRGAGDGWAAPGMDPAPTSFRDGERMRLVSPHQITGAVEFGILGTAMPSYEAAYTAEDRWSLAYYVAGLAEDPPSATSVGAAAEPELKRARDLERAFGRVAAGVFPAVAGVTLYRKPSKSTPPPDAAWREADADRYPGYTPIGSGSGFFVSADGFLITRAKLIAENGDLPPDALIDVEIPGNLHFRAHAIGFEPTVDLAVLKIEAPIPIATATLGNSDAVVIGQWVLALGDPPGAEKTLAPGVIAALPERDCYQEDRTSTLLQSSARIGRESFGGPLVDLDGRVVGMTVPGPGLEAGVAEGTVAALPIDLVRTLFEALKQSASTRSPWLGIAVLDLDRELRRKLGPKVRTGVYIEDVFDPSPASRAGVQVGDVLVALDGQRLFAVRDFQTWLYLLGIGRTITVVILRGEETLQVPMTIEERPAGAAPR